MTDLCVAGLPIRVESADKEFFDRRYAEYRREDDREPEMEMVTRLLDPIPEPQGELVEQIKNVTILRCADGRLCRFSRGEKTGRIPFAVYYTPDYTRVEIQLLASRRHPSLTRTDFEYMYTGSMFQNRLMMLDGCILHSSAIAWRGQGIAFSADSGTGKSTHTGLWKERFGDDVAFINDDKPAIRFEDGRPVMYGTPWSGKTALNLNRKAPLKAIVFIERGEQNSIRRLDDMDSMFRLTGQISRPYYDRGLGVRSVDIADRLRQSVPIYCLTCNISQQAVEVAFNEIFKEE